MSTQLRTILRKVYFLKKEKNFRNKMRNQGLSGNNVHTEVSSTFGGYIVVIRPCWSTLLHVVIFVDAAGGSSPA